ncbi:FAD-dependent oxidoreductase [Streptomyces sp. M19]
MTYVPHPSRIRRHGMAPTYDVIVLGLGGMGSAAAHHLAARGVRVLGLEKFGPVHNRGSSHGGSRIIRQSYFEDPAYVPLLLRAYELYERLERDTGRTLLTRCGGVMVGRPDSRTVAGSLRSARQWGLPHETLDAAAIRRRFPTLTPAEDEVALYEARAGSSAPSTPSPRSSNWPGRPGPSCATRNR